jgi:hypothetical protein
VGERVVTKEMESTDAVEVLEASRAFWSVQVEKNIK